MMIEFKLPNIGEGVESADVAEILVAEGDTIEPEQVVAELETEKAVVELPCPYQGRITKIHFSEGDTISVGETFLTLEGDAAPEGDGASAKRAPAREEPAAASAEETRETEPEHQAEPATSEQPAGEQPPRKLVEFPLPPIGEGVESAEIAELLVSAGDEIKADAIVMELETEKAVVDLPCPYAGRIEELNVAAGDTVQVGQVLFRIMTASPAAGPAETPEKEAAQPAEASPTRPGPRESPAEPPVAAAVSPQHTMIVADVRSRESGDGRAAPPVPAAPSTRRLARQLGVNLRMVQGSGAGGRITRDDVKAFVKQRLQGPGVPAVASAGGGVIAAGSLAPPPLPDFTKFGAVEREKLNRLARTAAENLTVSWNVIPHVTQHDRADITELEAARKKFINGIGQNSPKVTMTAIAIKALATCLQASPKFNSSLDPQTHELVLKKFYHIGCAVDTEHGLVVPVIRDCDQKSILQVASELNELAALARDRKLPLEAMQGATCTVTNLGGIGGTAFTPIVNYPEVCILGMARTQQELRIVDGEIHERLMLPLALSYDHRVINGADAARFVTALCNMLADPFDLMSAI
jgi:pyruvate dehydrogenase E2 component (dihydrolipoyllysine-residue acetyltransferase)